MKNDSSNTATAPVTELPDSVRIPLHSLQADLGYLIGRVIADSSCGPMIVKSMRDHLDLIEVAVRELAFPAREETGIKPVAFVLSNPPFKQDDNSHLAAMISRHEGLEYKFPLYASPPAPDRAGVRDELAAWLCALEDATSHTRISDRHIQDARRYISAGKTQPHDGDCTNKCFSCVVCGTESYLLHAGQILENLAALTPGSGDGSGA